jgi:hypothetical protein
MTACFLFSFGPFCLGTAPNPATRKPMMDHITQFPQAAALQRTAIAYEIATV